MSDCPASPVPSSRCRELTPTTAVVDHKRNNCKRRTARLLDKSPMASYKDVNPRFFYITSDQFQRPMPYQANNKTIFIADHLSYSFPSGLTQHGCGCVAVVANDPQGCRNATPPGGQNGRPAVGVDESFNLDLVWLMRVRRPLWRFYSGLRIELSGTCGGCCRCYEHWWPAVTEDKAPVSNGLPRCSH